MVGRSLSGVILGLAPLVACSNQRNPSHDLRGRVRQTEVGRPRATSCQRITRPTVGAPLSVTTSRCRSGRLALAPGLSGQHRPRLLPPRRCPVSEQSLRVVRRRGAFRRWLAAGVAKAKRRLRGVHGQAQHGHLCAHWIVLSRTDSSPLSAPDSADWLPALAGRGAPFLLGRDGPYAPRATMGGTGNRSRPSSFT